MKKLIRGIVEFRKKLRPEYRDTFARLALGQSPDTLMIACSDSRVVPNLFASADPGDLFVIRNMGNLFVPYQPDAPAVSGDSEAAALEFALQTLRVTDLIVCGHSECGAMKAMIDGREQTPALHVRSWLRHADPALKRLDHGESLDKDLARHNQLSQLNVLQQMGHALSYPEVKDRVKRGHFRVHGWWFDIEKADVYAYEESANRFVLIDDQEAERILKRLGGVGS